jgi:hypothetical protein
MRRLQINRRRDSTLQRVNPSSDTKTPSISWFQAGKSPLRMGGDKVVTIENGEIEKVAGDLDANSM